MNSTPTLYDWLGGIDALEKLTARFYQKVNADPLIGPVFAHMSPQHSQVVAQFIAEVFHGPHLYTENHNGSHAGMVAQHIGRHLTEAQRRRWMELLLETADECGLPADPEFRSSFVGYLEWGSRIAVLNSNAQENPVDVQAPMPKWGWGETGGPYQPE